MWTATGTRSRRVSSVPDQGLAVCSIPQAVVATFPTRHVAPKVALLSTSDNNSQRHETVLFIFGTSGEAPAGIRFCIRTTDKPSSPFEEHPFLRQWEIWQPRGLEFDGTGDRRINGGYTGSTQGRRASRSDRLWRDPELVMSVFSHVMRLFHYGMLSLFVQTTHHGGRSWTHSWSQ